MDDITARSRRSGSSGTAGAKALVLLLVAFCLTGCERTSDDQPPSGVLLITVDTLRADHLGCYGAPGDPTPNIDRLAGEGVRFLDASTPIPVTLPAHASLMTAVPPPVHGVRDNGIFRLGPSLPTLAESLRDGGWAGAAFVGSVVLDAAYGLDRGFEHYDGTIRVPVRPDRAGVTTYPERPAGDVVDAALQWLRDRPEGSRFFLWVHLFDPHFPYLPPEPVRDRFGATYRGEVTYTDQEIGRLLDGLASLGRAEETLVVLTSDHGEGLGEHGEMTHGYFLYQSTLHVPLILRLPGRLPAGGEVGGPVSLVDVAPTMLDLAGQQPLPGADGVSLAGAAVGGEAPDRPLYLESYLPYLEMKWSGSRGLRRGGWKYLHATGPELYDLTVDPDEQRDLAASRPEVAGRMESELRSSVVRMEAVAPGDQEQPPLDEEEEARLRSLGYLSAGAGSTDDLPARAALRPDTRSRIHLLDSLLLAAPAAIDRRDPEALAQLRDLARQDSDNPRLLTLVGKALIAQGRTADAVPVLRQAAELDPEDPRLHANLAAALLRDGRREEAAAVIDRALALDSDEPAVRRLYGDLLLNFDPKRAEEIFLDLLRGNPEDLPALRGLAWSLVSQNRWEEALAATDRVLLLEPTSVDDMVRAGMAAIRLDRMDEAGERLRRALAQSANHVGALLGLGLVLEKQQDADGALRMFERAVRIAPDDPVVLFSYARAAARSGDAAGARRALEDSLTIKPDQPAARELLRRLDNP